MIIHPLFPVVSLAGQSPTDCRDRLRYPAPQSHVLSEYSGGLLASQTDSDRASSTGPIFRSVSYVQQGNIRLECLWLPLWDTQRAVLRDATVSFFQNPNGRSQIETNLATSGMLSWPKRHYVWEIELLFGHPYPGIFECLVRFIIGGKMYFAMPVRAMWKREAKAFAYFAPFLVPLYIPPIQNFTVQVIPKRAWGEPVEMMTVLHGYMLREIS